LLSMMIAFATENAICVVHDLGDFKIVGKTYQVPVPHGGPVYMYKNYGVLDKDGNVIVEQKYEDTVWYRRAICV